ncbi:MAG: HAD-IA family hydrolase [Streptococcaceae bacterium]|nr:HAD-IA family hydrolase [Streptococcaceae bacterium]
MRFQNYIWDFDGTLYDSYDGMADAFLLALQEFGVVKEKREVYRLMKKESVRFATHHYVGVERQQALMDRYHEIEARRLRPPNPFPETKAMLEAIKAYGGRHFVLTHRDQSAIDFLKEDGLFPLFTDFVTENLGFQRKPHPESLLFLLEKHQLKAEDTVMIGDRLLDVLAGKNAGVSTILYDIDGFLGEIPADYTVHALDEILKI